MNISAQILLQHSIDNLRLSVRLRVICCAKSEFSPTETKKVAPKSTEENGVSVRDDVVGKVVMFANNVQEEDDNLMSSVMLGKGTQVDCFRVTIHHDQDSRVALRYW